MEFCRWHFVVITNVTGDFYTLELPYLVVIALYLINIHKLDPVFNWPPLVLSLIISSKFLIFLTYTKHFLLLYAGFHLWQLLLRFEHTAWFSWAVGRLLPTKVSWKLIKNNTFFSLVYSCQLSLSRQPGLLKNEAVNCVPHTSMLCHWHHLCVTFLEWKLVSLFFKI